MTLGHVLGSFQWMDQVYQVVFGHPPPSPHKITFTSPKTNYPFYIGIAAITVSAYIIYPTLFPSKTMFTRRPDKYATGLQNLRNDCFANLSLQALLALPSLTEYLNLVVEYHALVDEFLGRHHLKQKVVELRGATVKKQKGRIDWVSLDIPLHHALAALMKRLQDTTLTAKTISVWTFLHSLEDIFKSKILRSQHDAHELTMLIMETLEVENSKLKLFADFITENLDQWITAGPEDYAVVAPVVDFPFAGLILSKMQCVSCQQTSKPNFTPFLMMTLSTPQQLTTSLDDMLLNQQQELIEGYHCLVCRAKYILSQIDETHRHRQLLETMATSGYINDDFSPDVDAFVKQFRNIGEVSSTVVSTHQILKPPKIFGIHLSRLTFNGQLVIRNPCRIKFNDRVTLSIGRYHEELQLLNESLEAIHTKVLTSDVNDMENALVQNELFEEQGTEQALVDNTSITGGFGDITSIGSTTQLPNLLNATPDQLAKLQEQFSQFNFSDNDIYKYRLRLVIRHQGSHTQGHYEAYKRKPTYAKDEEGQIIRLSPEISNRVWQLSLGEPVTVEEKPGKQRKFSLLKKPEVIHSGVSMLVVDANLQLGVQLPAEIEVSDTLSQLLLVGQKAPVKLKKLLSVVKSPFWRILDSQVTEVLKEQVLNEQLAVYMLYYEMR